MATEHLAKSFEEELKRLNSLIARMGGLTESQIADSIQAVGERDSELAAEVVAGDDRIDALEREVDDLALKILALRQPLASDLRRILSALKISADLERIADYAANVAKRALALNQVAAISPVHAVPQIGRAHV